MQVQPPLNNSPFDSASVGLPFNFNYTISMVFSFVIKHEWIKKSSIEKDQTDVTASHLLREGFSILLFPNRPTPRVGKTVVISVWRLFCPRGHALSTYAKKGGGGVSPLRTPLHKCDVTYVVSPAYKGGGGVKKSRNFAYVLCARPLSGKKVKLVCTWREGACTKYSAQKDLHLR